MSLMARKNFACPTVGDVVVDVDIVEGTNSAVSGLKHKGGNGYNAGELLSFLVVVIHNDIE